MVPPTIVENAEDGEVSAAARREDPAKRLLSFVVLWMWCGIVAGLLEVGMILLRKRVIGANRFVGMSQHFVWLIPVTNLLIFLGLGLVLGLFIVWRPAPGRWLHARMLCAMTLLPSLLVAVPEVYFLAWLILALGIASWAVPVLERRADRFQRSAGISLPVLACLVAVSSGYLFGSDWLRRRSEARRPFPAPGSPNVLWIVLDTVGADHLSLYGYTHRTSSTLEELAKRGIRFDRAQATAPWTLPSHASFFTGRWPHELSAGWMMPLDSDDPTIAEYLGGKGYATAGFVANRFFCGWDSGLGRGFTHYEDHALPQLGAFRLAAMVDRFLEGIRLVDRFHRNWLGFQVIPPVEDFIVGQFTGGDRKEAAVVNREFLAWLSARASPTGRSSFS